MIAVCILHRILQILTVQPGQTILTFVHLSESCKLKFLRGAAQCSNYMAHWDTELEETQCEWQCPVEVQLNIEFAGGHR